MILGAILPSLPARASCEMQPPSKVSGMHGVSWKEREILDLLDIWGDTKMQEALCSSHRNIGNFEKIAAEMVARGHRRSVEECRTKTKMMQMEYRKVLAHNNQTGNNPAICPFFDEPKKIFGSGSASVPQRLVRSIQYKPPTPEPPEPDLDPQPQPEFQPAPGSEEMFSHYWHTVDIEQIRESEPGDAQAVVEAEEEDSDTTYVESFPNVERASISSQAAEVSLGAVPVGAAEVSTTRDDPGEGTSTGQPCSSPSSGLPRSRNRKRRVPGLASISDRMMEQSRLLFERESEERRQEITQCRQDRLLIHDTRRRGVTAMESACQALHDLVAMQRTQASVTSGPLLPSMGEGERQTTPTIRLGVAAGTPMGAVQAVPPRAGPSDPQGASAPQPKQKRLRVKKFFFSP